MLRTTLLKILLAIVAVVVPLADAVAQAPERPIRMLVGFPPGQAIDLIARVLAEHLSRELGRTVVVENRPGAGGSIALATLAQSPADGSVITLSALASYAINPHLYKNVQYDPLRDLIPIALVADIPVVLVATPSFPADTFAEFVQYVRARPGKLAHSSSGNGTVSHLGMEELKRLIGVEMLHVPYQGSARAMADLAAGQVQVGLDSVAAVKSLVESKRLKVLAAASPARLPAFPDAPTIAESGFPGFEVSAWAGVSVPAGTPQETCERLSDAVVKIVKSAEFAARANALGAPPRPLPMNEFALYLRSEHERWGKAVRASGAKVD